MIAGIKKLASTDSSISVKITDTTGSIKFDYSIHLTLEIKRINTHFTYDISCKELSNKEKDVTTNLKLVGAFDEINTIGGYCRESKDAAFLSNSFEVHILKLLRKKGFVILNQE